MKLVVNQDIELWLVVKEHVEAIYQLADKDRNYLREWLPWVDKTKSSKDVTNYVERANAAYKSKKGYNFTVVYKTEMIGQVSLVGIDLDNRKAMIGYWMGKDYQGLGIVSKACTKIIDFGFNEINLNRIEIKCGVENYKSQAIPERLGFTKEGIIRDGEFVNDKFIDLLLYSKLKND